MFGKSHDNFTFVFSLDIGNFIGGFLAEISSVKSFEGNGVPRQETAVIRKFYSVLGKKIVLIGEKIAPDTPQQKALWENIDALNDIQFALHSMITFLKAILEIDTCSLRFLSDFSLSHLQSETLHSSQNCLVIW